MLNTLEQQKRFWDREWASGKRPAGTAFYSVDVQNMPNCTVLDVGCGDAVMLRQSTFEKTSRPVGMDLSRSALLRSERAWDEFYCTGKRFPLIQGAAQMLPFRDSSFDWCISNDAISLLGEGYVDALREMLRVSRKGISFGVTHKDFFEWQGKIGLKFKTIKLDHCDSIVTDEYNILVFDEPGVIGLAHAIGGRLVEVRTETKHDVIYKGVPFYERTEVPGGEVKCSLVVTIEKGAGAPPLPSVVGELNIRGLDGLPLGMA